MKNGQESPSTLGNKEEHGRRRSSFRKTGLILGLSSLLTLVPDIVKSQNRQRQNAQQKKQSVEGRMLTQPDTLFTKQLARIPENTGLILDQLTKDQLLAGKIQKRGVSSNR